MRKLSYLLPLVYGISASLNLLQDIFIIKPSLLQVFACVVANLVGVLAFYFIGKALDKIMNK